MFLVFKLHVQLNILLDCTVTSCSKFSAVLYSSVSKPPGRGPIPGPGINYTGPREILLQFLILVS